MRWQLLLVAVLLVPGLALGHGGHEHGNATAGSSGPTPKPGAWPPPANGTVEADRTAAGAASAPLPYAAPSETTATSPGTREWATFKGDPGRTGANGAKPPLAPQAKWSASGTAGVGIFAPPVVASGLVVFAGLDRHAHALDATTGFGLWSAPLPSMAFASPTVVDDKVLVAASEGTLLALDLRAGTERWRADLGGKTSASPLVHNGVAYAVTETGRVLALNVSDGALRWNRTVPPIGSVVAPTWAAGRLIVGDGAGQVHALHPLTGQTLWTTNVGTPVTATPVAAGKQLIVPTLGLKALEPETGRVLWSKVLGAFVRSSPAYQAGLLVYGDPEAPGVVGASALTGEPVWKVPTRLFVRSSPAIAQDVAVAAADDGSILAMRMKNGTVLWTLDAGERMRASPVVLEGRLFAARMDGLLRLYADAAAPSLAAEGPAATATDRSLIEAAPVVALAAVPFLGAKLARDRLRRSAPAPEAAGAGDVEPARPSPPPRVGGHVRVACPGCACRFGVDPGAQPVVVCPGCGLRSEVRRRQPGRVPGAPPRQAGL